RSFVVHIIDSTNYWRYQVRVTKLTQMATQPSPTPSPETAVSEFAGQLFFRLWRAPPPPLPPRLRRPPPTRIPAALESVGLTPARFGLLNLLGSLEGANQQELGAAMGVDPSTMVQLIDDLEAAGLAKR